MSSHLPSRPGNNDPSTSHNGNSDEEEVPALESPDLEPLRNPNVEIEEASEDDEDYQDDPEEEEDEEEYVDEEEDDDDERHHWYPLYPDSDDELFVIPPVYAPTAETSLGDMDHGERECFRLILLLRTNGS